MTQSRYIIQALEHWSSLNAGEKFLVAECLKARSSDPSQIACHYLYGLFIASAAKVLWKDITIDNVSRITFKVDYLQSGVSLFIHNILATTT
jgi:hypothetical protein